mmetsp:Transcript_7492/g.20525  ORF Transcript_7492/g.20525 Transcript_7492/m.20525 type:complete len:281 (-) Transcript_7492:68-910(-)
MRCQGAQSSFAVLRPACTTSNLAAMEASLLDCLEAAVMGVGSLLCSSFARVSLHCNFSTLALISLMRDSGRSSAAISRSLLINSLTCKKDISIKPSRADASCWMMLARVSDNVSEASSFSTSKVIPCKNCCIWVFGHCLISSANDLRNALGDTSASTFWIANSPTEKVGVCCTSHSSASESVGSYFSSSVAKTAKGCRDDLLPSSRRLSTCACRAWACCNSASRSFSAVVALRIACLSLSSRMDFSIFDWSHSWTHVPSDSAHPSSVDNVEKESSHTLFV